MWRRIEGGSPISVDGSGRRRSLLAAVAISVAVAAFAYGAGHSPRAADAPDVVAYNEAVASGDPAALRNFVLAYPTSPLAQQALAELQQWCTLHPVGREEVCDLESLVVPAAGVVDEPTGSPTGDTTRDSASES